MNIIGCLILVILFLLVVFSYGEVFVCLNDKKNKAYSFSTKIVVGCMVMMAVFESVFFPCMIAKAPFHILYYVFLLITLIVFSLSIYLLIKQGKVSHFTHTNHINPVVILITIFVVILAIYVAVVHYESYDYGYYVAISNIALEEDRIVLNTNEAYTGDVYFNGICPRPTINSWELLIAFFCKLFKVHPAIATHTILPLVLIPIYVLAALIVFRKVCKDRIEVIIALFLYILLGIYFDKSMYLISPYFTVGSSNGKAILWYLLFPLVVYYGIDLYSEKDNSILWKSFFLLPLAAACATATGIYTIPIYYATIAIPYLVLRKLSKKEILGKMKNMILCLIPVVILGVYSLFSIIEIKDSWLRFEFDYVTLLREACSKSFWCILIFIICVFIIAFFGKKDYVSQFFIGKTVILMITVFNPLFSGKIAQYITGTQVFDRMFLLFSAIFVIPMGVIYLYRRFENHIVQGIIIILATSVVFLQGREWNTFKFYDEQLPFQNVYMIRNNCYNVIKWFDEYEANKKIRLVADYSVNRFFRQYSSRFCIIGARSDTISYDEVGDKYVSLYDELFVDNIVTDNTINLLKYFDIEYVVSVRPIITNGKLELVYTDNDSLYLYRENE